MGYTLEQLQKAGFKPEAPAGPKRMTLEELQAMGFKPPPESDPFLPGSVDLSQPYEKKISPARAEILGGSQGATLGFGEEIGAGVVSQSPTLRPNPGGVRFGPAMAPSPDDTPEIRRLKLEAFDQYLASQRNDPLAYGPLRDRMRAELAQAQQQRPREYMTGEMAGSLLTAPILPTGAGSGSPLGRTLVALGTGAGYGAASGVGSSNAPMESREMAGDALRGAAWGAGGAAAGMAVPWALRRTGRALQALGLDAGRRHLINAKTLTTQAPLPDDSVRAALTSGSILPGTMASGTFGRLEKRAAEQGKRYAEIVKTLEDAGVTAPGYREFAQQLAAEGRDVAANSLGSSVPQRYAEMADELLEKGGLRPPSSGGHGHHGKPAAPEAPALLDEFGRPLPKAPPAALPDKPIPLTTAENIKRSLQEQARKEYRRVGGDTLAAEAKKKTAAIVNRGIEEKVAEAGAAAVPGSPVAVASGQFVPTKRRLGDLIGAREEARLGAAKVAQHAEFGLPQQMTIAQTLADKGVGPALGAALKTWPMRQALNRSSSTIATGAFWPGVGAERLGAALTPVAPGLSRLGGAAGRALGMRPEPPTAPEPLPEGPEADFQRWLLEQDMLAKSRPAGAPLRRLVAKGGAPIDRSRPIIQNPDGSFSTERTITIEADGKQIIIPTIVGGQQRTPQEAVRLWRAGANPSVGIFDTPAEAEAYAQRRSREIGRVRAGDALRRRK